VGRRLPGGDRPARWKLKQESLSGEERLGSEEKNLKEVMNQQIPGLHVHNKERKVQENLGKLTSHPLTLTSDAATRTLKGVGE